MADFSKVLGSSPIVSQAQLAWIKADQKQKIAITLNNVRDIDANAWEPMEEAEIHSFMALCWENAQKLRIVDRVSFAYFCYYSICWGLYFYLDPRWGRNKQLMENVAIPAQLRLERVSARIFSIEETCYGVDFAQVRERGWYYCQTDLAQSLPYEIGDMVRLLETVFRRHWPQRLEHLPPLYFENTVVYMKQQCTELRLYGKWDVLVASALALTVGRYFFHDPAFEWLARAFFAKDKLTGRDKVLKILRITQAVLRKHLTRAA